ncbi:MAG: hypothetical protein K2M99_05520, partial [Treponemataceae bacterium]|nr:hypothetical protein [Treponemataceae bacterium]
AKYAIPAELLPSLPCKLAHKTGKQGIALRPEVKRIKTEKPMYLPPIVINLKKLYNSILV